MPFSISSLASSNDFFERSWCAPGVAADGVTCGRDLLEDAGLVGGVLADREEDRLGAVRRHGVHHGHGALRPRTVIEGQHDFARTQEVVIAGNVRNRSRGRRSCRSRPCARRRVHSDCRGRTRGGSGRRRCCGSCCRCGRGLWLRSLRDRHWTGGAGCALGAAASGVGRALCDGGVGIRRARRSST